MTRFSFVRAPLLFLLLASFICWANAQSTSGLYSFCYATYNSWATSPYLQWAFLTHGTLNVSWIGINATAGTVTDASATRAAYYGGNMTSNSSIVGVALPNTYGGNDNVVSIGNGTALLSATHALVLLSSSPVPFASGPVVTPSFPLGMKYIALMNRSQSGFAEWDNPINDGELNVVISSWQWAPSSGGLQDTWSGCTLSVPPSINNAASDVALYQSSGPSSVFCMDNSAGPGDGTTDGGSWNIVASGTVQTSGYQGVTTSGRLARLITAVSGSRSWVFENGSAITANINLTSLNAAAQSVSNANNSLAATLAASLTPASNVLYSSWPPMDESGWALLASADLAIQPELDAHTRAFRLSIDNTSLEFSEAVVDGISGQLYQDRTGTFYNQDLSSATASEGSASFNVSQWSQQCSINYGNVSQYEYCYYIDNSEAPTTNRQRGIIYAYGLFMGAGPQPQQGRQALRVQKITGVRVIVSMSNGSTSTQTQNLKHIKYISQDTTLGVHNDNLIYLSSPYIDLNGLIIETNNNALMFNGVSGNTDINLRMTAFGLSEFDADGVSVVAATNTTLSGFFYQPIGGSTPGVTSQCAAYNAVVGVVPAVTTYSFCYAQSTSSYNVSVTATLWLYQTAVTYLTRHGFPIAAITGTRVYTDVFGVSSNNTIIGPSSDWFAKQLNPSETYDQLVYSTYNTSLVDASGILYQIVGRAETPSGPAFGPYVVRVFQNASNNQYQEEIETDVLNGVWQFSELQGLTLAVVADGGQSAANGSVLSTYCKFGSPSSPSNANAATQMQLKLYTALILLLLILSLLDGA